MVLSTKRLSNAIEAISRIIHEGNSGTEGVESVYLFGIEMIGWADFPSPSMNNSSKILSHKEESSIGIF